MNAAYRAVQKACREAGDGLPVTEQTLRKRLQEKGLLRTKDVSRGTLTMRRTICGTSMDVLILQRTTLLPEVSDADEEAG